MKKTVEEIEGMLIFEMLTPTCTTSGGKRLVVEEMKDGNFGFPIHYKLLMGYDTFMTNEDDWNEALVYSDLTDAERKHLYECVLYTEHELP